MTTARILTICVGISAYRPAALDPGERPLQFLADSARDLSRHFAAMWPRRNSKHLLIVDEAATLANVASLIASAMDPYDICILYMGGHARVGKDSFEFLFFGETPDDTIASSSVIDAIVAIPKTDSILLFLDTCCAGKYGEETTFFRSPSARGRRICVASTLRSQRNWEDPQSRRSLFVDAMIKAFTAQYGSDRLARHDTDGLFNDIATDVARHASSLKRGIAQVPILVSSLRDAPYLPVDKHGARHERSKSANAVPVLRILMIALVSTVIMTLSVAVLSRATWHPAINGSGYVELRSGPEWLSFLKMGPWRLRVETDVTSANLIGETHAPDRSSPLFTGQGFRPWPGINDAQVRRWADVFLDEYLNAEAVARWRVRLGYEDAVKRLTTVITTGGAGVPAQNLQARRVVAVRAATELAAEAKILDPLMPLADVWKLQWRENVTAISCTSTDLPKEAIEPLSIYLNSAESDVFTRWLRGLALTARVDDEVGIEEVAQLAEMFAAANTLRRRENGAAAADPKVPGATTKIAHRYAKKPTIREAAAFAEIASAIVSRRLAASREPISPSERTRLRGILNSCADAAMPALAALGGYGDPGRVIAWARARPTSNLGRLSLHELAVSGALPSGEIIWNLDAQGFSGDPAARKQAFMNAHEWLLAVSDVMPLPRDVLARLVEYANERLSAEDTEGARQALSVILRSPYAVQPPLGAQVYKLIDRVMPPQQARKMPSKNVLAMNQGDLELLGLLARSGASLSDEQRKMVMNVMERNDYKGIPRVHFTESDKGEARHAAQLVVAVTSAHLLALSRFIIGVQDKDDPAVNNRAQNFLQQGAADAVRYGVPLERIRDVLLATAIARKKTSGKSLDAAGVSVKMRSLAADAAARRAEVEITKAALSLMPKSQSALVVDSLRTYWRREQEPETKLALAEIIIGATANQ